MHFGFPCNLTVYKLFTDWGSIFGGFLALLAGGFAYYAGKEQANATSRAADRQLQAQATTNVAEAESIKAALRAEVIAYAKCIIGSLEICQIIAAGAPVMPRSDADAIVRGLPEPTVFPAVADRIALVRSPHLPVQFFMRIAEVKSMASTFSRATIFTSDTPNTIEGIAFLDHSNALAIADCLITALQLGREIIEELPNGASNLERLLTDRTLYQIDSALTAAQVSFPEAESFPEKYPSGEGRSV